MAACRRIICLAGQNNILFYRSSKLHTSSAISNVQNSSNEIVVPHRIERGPTDILKALASTISKDYTAAHYKYEDDPYFIPASNITKRSFALSKESGKKAARYFLEKYPEFFKCNTSVPHIKAFDPPVIYTEEDNVTPETLESCIQSLKINNCITVYNILKKKGIPVCQTTKQNFLELLCFYNNIQPAEEDYYEERYFSRNEDQETTKWNPKGMAETLFLDMEKDGKAYSSMIAGASKFGAVDRAVTLYDEMRSKNIIGTAEAHNGILTVIPYIKESGESRWEYALHILNNMNNDGLQPNLYTMNAVLSVISRSKRFKNSKSAALSILAEMKRLRIEPSLGTYFHILAICSIERKPDALYAIINNIEGAEELFIRHPTDVRFFSTAMDMCWKVAHDKELAYRIHNLLESKHNCRLLGSAHSESLYFKAFFRLLCEMEDFDKFMVLYEKYVPHTYTPEPSVIFDIVQAIHFNGLYKYLPRICSDILVFEQTERENIIFALLEAAGCMKHETQTQNELVDLIWKIMEKITRRSEGGRFMFNWTGTSLGNVLKTFMNGIDSQKAWSIMEKLKNEKENIIGHPEKDTLLAFCEMCLLEKEFEKTNFCVKYAVNGAYPDFHKDFAILTKTMFQAKTLSEVDRVHINEILRKVTLEDSSSDSSSSSDDSSSDEENAVQQNSPKM